VFSGSRHQVELQGEWHVGGVWSFGPLRADGVDLGSVEAPDADCWQGANVGSIGAALAVVRGELSPEQGIAAGLFNLERARPIDDCVRGAFGAR